MCAYVRMRVSWINHLWDQLDVRAISGAVVQCWFQQWLHNNNNNMVWRTEWRRARQTDAKVCRRSHKSANTWTTIDHTWISYKLSLYDGRNFHFLPPKRTQRCGVFFLFLGSLLAQVELYPPAAMWIDVCKTLHSVRNHKEAETTVRNSVLFGSEKPAYIDSW